jgi:hypothetical protein
MKLIATVASQRVENIPRRALRVNANDRRRAMDVAKDQGERSFPTLFASFIPGMHAPKS